MSSRIGNPIRNDNIDTRMSLRWTVRFIGYSL
jgi:hypothetical protein